MTSREIPMFPLGSVLLPSMVLPLHIFEPRYQAMIEVVMASEDRSFGVVLIERGHEVGGDDQRVNVGTLARVLETERADDGRWGLISVGVERIRVDDWLTDDPYPRAMVSDFPDSSDVGPDEVSAHRELLKQHRRLLGLSSELGYDVGPIQELSEDPVLGSFQIAATAPISVYDRYQLLAAPTLAERLPMLAEHLESALALAQMEMEQAINDPSDPSDEDR